MIRRIIGFSLYYGLGVGSALVAMLTVLPAARYGGDPRPASDRGVQHALLVEGNQACPAVAMAEATTRCPYLAMVTARSKCPYLAGSSARSACPYLPYAAGEGACPYLEGGRDADTDATTRPPGPPSQDVDAPEHAVPKLDGTPKGTVLARFEAAHPATQVSDRS